MPVTAPCRVREQQRAASESAIVDAAIELFAAQGPDGTSLRDVAARAGCSHVLIVRYFGGKEGLVGAVADAFGTRVDRCVAHVEATADDPLVELLDAARRLRPWTQLLVRSALGDLSPRGRPACVQAPRLLTLASGGRAVASSGRRGRLAAYLGASLLLGYVTFADFVDVGARLNRLSVRRRDRAIVAAAHRLLGVIASGGLELPPHNVDVHRSHTPIEPSPSTARDALLRSATELFAARGPASVSVRDVARHAGVNQGLIYRHFGSKRALLSEVLDFGVSGLLPAALAPDGFDFDEVSRLLHRGSPAPRLIARTLVDDVEIATVRRRFPILRRLLDAYDDVPTGSGPGDLGDPRVAVAATAAVALGSSIWGAHLRPVLGLSERDGLDAAVADAARWLVSVPHADSFRGETRR